MHKGIMQRQSGPRIALVTDWMTSFGGEHRVLETLHEMFPQAPIYTTVYNQKELKAYKKADIKTSFLDRFPFSPWSKKHFKKLLPLMPYAFESFDLSDFDIVISSSHACSKGIITNVDTVHICYCHSPMRYAWEDCHRYINENAPLKWLGGRAWSQKLMHKIRMWDRLAADRPDYMIANSKFIGRQIAKFYKRESRVIYPPIDTSRFHISDHKANYYLAGGRLIPNKKIDIVVDAFNELGLPLKIFGKGPELEKLMAKAKDNIEFLGFVADKDMPYLFSRAKAFIVPQLEDFGIVTVEALASGTPVLGYNKGGTAEIVKHGITGLLMNEQTPEALVQLVKDSEKLKFNPDTARQHALTYDTSRFKRDMHKFITEVTPR